MINKNLFILSIGCGTFIISVLIVSSYIYKYKSDQAEKKYQIEQQAIKAGYQQVPVSICLSAEQSLRWIKSGEEGVPDMRDTSKEY